MTASIALTDPQGSSSETRPIWDRFFVRLLNDPRDLPFIHLMISCSLVAALGVGLFFVGSYLWFLAPIYLLIWAFGVLDRFILMLHCTSHRQLFKPAYRKLNLVIPWVLCPFFGETPDTYFAHHLGMHHPENNLHDDLSSTMRYRRDSFSHWLLYFFRFFFLSMPQLSSYHFKKGNYKLLARMLLGELSFYALALALCVVNWQATLVVFIGPLVAVRLLMMAGNWGQHAFVDAADPANAYKNSITCINSRYNRRCFNDGYHIHHHVKARCHWTEYPAELRGNLAGYAKEDAILFEGIDFFIVWVFLMLHRYDWLARHFVRLPGAKERSDAEVIALLRSRVEPIPRAC